MAPAPGRRVSYVIPSPSGPVPRLSLPPIGTLRHGKTSPILIPSNEFSGEANGGRGLDTRSQHPRHRLGVAAFALDTATQLSGRDTPEGILYTGGRDGMVMAWDLELPMRQRSLRSSAFSQVGGRRLGRWERLTRDDEDDNAIYEEDGDDDGDDWPTSDGDVLGDVKTSGGRRGYWTKQADIPYEQRWEIDVKCSEPGQPTSWMQSTQAHSDWVNDILLCNLNQTVISGSSDGTVKAWNPYSSVPSLPATVGTHSDYVRCLTQSRERNWLFSGSFDRTIKLWDLSQPRSDPLVTLLPPESPGPKSSVYAVASDPFGHVVASGGPERVVRTWDPRTGKRTGKLVGHTDNIRAILMSDDSRYLLTGSADASIKLWSILSPQRCIYTFTHHTESVWSLFSSHPSLEIFYSGDRSGIVCRVDVEECDRISQGECVVLCKDNGEPNMAASEGVSKIVAMDDHLVWTASGSSSIRRWRVPQGRIERASTGSPDSPLTETNSPISLHRRNSFGKLPKPPDTPEASSKRRMKGQSITPSITASFFSSSSSLPHDLDTENAQNGIPYECLVRLTAPNAHHAPLGFSRGREAEVATLYSAASVMSVSRHPRSPSGGQFADHSRSQSQGQASLFTRRDTLSPPAPDGMPFVTTTARTAYEDRDVAPDATPLVTEPDVVIEGEQGLVRVSILNDRIHALTVDTAGAVAIWDIVRGKCVGMFTRAEVHTANASTGCSVSSGGTGTRNAEKISPRQALEIVRDRIEGEAVVLPWANADTKIGELTIHISDRCFEAEIFADEALHGYERSYGDDYRLNIGKWILRNLFLGFIEEEQKAAFKQSQQRVQPSAYRVPHSQPHRTHLPSHPRAATEAPSGNRTPGLTSASIPPVPPLPSDVVDTGSQQLSGLRLQGLSPIAQSLSSSVGNEALTTPRSTNTRSKLASTPLVPDSIITAKLGANATPGSAVVPSPMPSTTNTSTTPSTSTATSSNDYFSLRRRPSTSQSGSTAHTTGAPDDDFSGWGGPGSTKGSIAHESGLTTPSTPGGFMGRLKNLGKGSRRAATEAETPSASGNPSNDRSEGEGEGDDPTLSPSPPMTFIQHLKSQPLTPPSSSEAPTLAIPFDVSIIVSEDLSSGWMPMYRGSVGTTAADIHILEDALPEWILEFLLMSKAPVAPVTKMSFVLLPVQIPLNARAEYGDTLPELLNSTQSKLSASRFLRVRKLTNHVQDKLDKNLQSKPSSPRSSSDIANTHARGSSSPASAPSSLPTSRASTPRLSSNLSLQGHGHGAPALPRAEDTYEILCNDHVLPLDMTLAAVRQFVWRSASELIMHYRRKPRSSSSGAMLEEQTILTPTEAGNFSYGVLSDGH
ncbi:hypothetical protein EW145_g4683 [Phellinidium pouzarii]|uniref:Uncharacterized protein n=1 Tax=Phellinidium pouzarii TaxID=167371 RepID=A0A4S4L2T6_9AGAM|nr:hypothetical protein EW145_g4683 [Phellinidium pouzarii]